MRPPADVPSREETLAALLADPDVARGFREAERVIVNAARAGGDHFVRFGAARPASPAEPGGPATPPRPTTSETAAPATRRTAGAPPLPAPRPTSAPERPTPPGARANPHPWTPGPAGHAAEVITLPRRTGK